LDIFNKHIAMVYEKYINFIRWKSSCGKNEGQQTSAWVHIIIRVCLNLYLLFKKYTGREPIIAIFSCFLSDNFYVVQYTPSSAS
jgi:hypothetical protein